MRYYDDLIDESFLLLRDVEEILTVDTAVQNHVASSPLLAFNYRISPFSATNITLSNNVTISVPDVIILALNNTFQTMLSYQTLGLYDPITDLETDAITDLDGGIVTSLSYLTDVQLIISLGITVQNALQELISTSPELVLPVQDIVASNSLAELKTVTPTLAGALNILSNSATQLLPTQQAYLARALLFTLSNAVHEHIADSDVGLAYNYFLGVDSSLQRQVVDSITSSVAHSILAGSSVQEIRDDTAYLAGAISTLLSDSLQTITSDALVTGLAANLLADNTLQTVTDADVICHVVYALLLNTATQIINDSGIDTQIEGLLVSINDALNQIKSTSPTLTGILSLLINDSRNLILADDAYVATGILMAINDGLQQLDTDSINLVRELLLITQNALHEQTATRPGVTVEELAVMVRHILARGYYLFKTRTKNKR